MNDRLVSPTTQARHGQAFPTLEPAEVGTLRRFGSPRRYRNGDRLMETGKHSPGMFVVLSGAIRITGRDGHGHDLPVVEHRAGMFSGELAQITGAPSFVDGVAVGDVEAILIEPDKLQALLVSEAALGEKIMRAFILRRVGLIESGAGGPILVGETSHPDVVRLRGFLTRNGIPHVLLDPTTDTEARECLAGLAASPSELPLVVCPDGSILRNPTEAGLARCIGMLDSESGNAEYDVAIVGAGPAGLAAAVYGASEGLSVVVADARAFGGQAGASARIENYFGFPTGISGQALTARAYTQAQKFGARMVIPAEVVRMHCDVEAAHFTLSISDGVSLRSRTVVVASGARYRRPDLPALTSMEGRGVWFWASPIEAKMCAGQEVVLVGGGNSAGQAAVFLSGHASKVWMIVRAASLAASMSKYLIDRIESIPNIELLARTEIVDAGGATGTGLESVTWRNRDSGERDTRPIRHVFLFLGADPSADWVKECGIDVDPRGFVKTGGDAPSAARQPLETNVAGAFAIGDVRSGSVKRVGAAIGEGAAVVAQIHAHLAKHSVMAANAASA
jgi:thioredoxin reductase (NADPH)